MDKQLEENSNFFLNKLKRLLNDGLDPLSVAIFSCKNTELNFNCDFSNTSKFIKNESYSIYNIPSLLRVLTLKSQITTEEIIRDIFKDNHDQFAYIIEWQEQKKVMVFDINNMKIFEDKTISNALSKNREGFLELMDSLKYDK